MITMFYYTLLIINRLIKTFKFPSSFFVLVLVTVGNDDDDDDDDGGWDINGVIIVFSGM